MALSQIFAVLLLATAASAQLFCPLISGGTTTYNWNPDSTQNVTVYTSTSQGVTYGPNRNCYFSIQANAPGRIVVKVLDNDIRGYSASISIRTDFFSGYLADWSYLTYSADRHSNFVSTTNRLYISFSSYSSPLDFSNGVRLSLTFLRPSSCLPGWYPIPLAGQSHCVGLPINKGFQFGEAQRYCNLQRSNLLVTYGDSVTNVLSRVPGAANVWIGMTAEPRGANSSYRWINNFPVDPRQPVSCTGTCTPGSTAHRCVQAQNQLMLAQIGCSTTLWPLCYMPVGGTDIFYAGSAVTRASGALLAGAVLLFWSLR